MIPTRIFKILVQELIDQGKIVPLLYNDPDFANTLHNVTTVMHYLQLSKPDDLGPEPRIIPYQTTTDIDDLFDGDINFESIDDFFFHMRNQLSPILHNVKSFTSNGNTITITTHRIENLLQVQLRLNQYKNWQYYSQYLPTIEQYAESLTLIDMCKLENKHAN